MEKRKKGFTLIELVVVIAIIGVLAAILVPVMMGYVRKSRGGCRKRQCQAELQHGSGGCSILQCGI